MRCYICNCNIEEPEFDVDHKALPCPECHNVVLDLLDDEEIDIELLDFDDYEEGEDVEEDSNQPEDIMP